MPYSCRDLWWSLCHLRLCVWFFWTPRTWRSDGELRSEVSCTLMGQRLVFSMFQRRKLRMFQDYRGISISIIVSYCIMMYPMGVYSQNGRASHQELLQFTVIFRNGNLVLKAWRYLTLRFSSPQYCLRRQLGFKKWIWCCGFERTPVPYP